MWEAPAAPPAAGATSSSAPAGVTSSAKATNTSSSTAPASCAAEGDGQQAQSGQQQACATEASNAKGTSTRRLRELVSVRCTATNASTYLPGMLLPAQKVQRCRVTGGRGAGGEGGAGAKA